MGARSIGTLAAAALALGACAEEGRQEAASNEAAAVNADSAPPAPAEKAPAAPAANAAAQESPHPCRVQDGKPVPPNLIRAVGNEPFWGARIDGRCVTYSTPEDLKGTRIWTRFSGLAEQGVWRGALDGQRFELRTNPQPGCSDTMSDKAYPIEVTLFVRGEERRGCAEPLAAGKRQ